MALVTGNNGSALRISMPILGSKKKVVSSFAFNRSAI